MSKKKLFALSVVVIMIAILSFSSLAWFTDADDVTNKFMVAGSDDADPDDIFSVDVWEDLDGDGKKDTDAGGTYQDILPGDVLDKEPHVVNTGSYDQYIRVSVTISHAKVWGELAKQGLDVTSVFVGFDATKWDRIWNNISENPNAEEIVYAMYYKEILKPGEEIVVFTDVKIPESLTQELAAAFEGSFTINVKADAVQTQNVGVDTTNDVCDAYEAFKYIEAN